MQLFGRARHAAEFDNAREILELLERWNGSLLSDRRRSAAIARVECPGRLSRSGGRPESRPNKTIGLGKGNASGFDDTFYIS
jgi:hypothetical protein